MAHQRRYRIRNWKDYNKALISRGSLTVWFDTASIQQWHKTERTGERGRPRDYSDQALLCVLTLRAIFHLPLRAPAQGFVASLMQFLQLPLRTPHYTVLCRRQNALTILKQRIVAINPLP